MKTIAAFCMLLDHIGMVFFPYQIEWRMIGRLAMPIFAFCVARGILVTSSLKIYIKRLGVFALVSQIPFWLLRWVAEEDQFITLHLNIGFTFLTAVLLISIWQIMYEEQEMTMRKKMIMGGGCVGLLVAADLLGMDYGSYGVLVVAACYLILKKGRSLFVLCMAYTFLTLIYNVNIPGLFLLQEIGVIGLVICSLTKNISERRMGRFFYFFYPLHMLMIGVISLLAA